MAAMPQTLSDFDYVLPPERIAQEGLPQRDQARMMVLPPSQAPIHASIRDLPNYFSAGDVIVMNETRVLKARMIGRKDTGRKVDCLIVSDAEVEAEKKVLLRGKAFSIGARIDFQCPSGETLTANVQEWLGGSKYKVRFSNPELIQKCAALPLPPYIKKPLAEPERYQTIYSKNEGSLAAPTAGLHFTPNLMEELKSKGVKFAFLTLHVGIGTFAPIRQENLEDIKIHSEYFSVPEEAAREINSALKEKRRIFAVGTTSVRTLETVMNSGRVEAAQGWTEIFIRPGYSFKTPLAGLLTNFHLPKSSLLLLTCAFAGRERILGAYREAVEKDYRFYSLGDAMLILMS